MRTMWLVGLTLLMGPSVGGCGDSTGPGRCSRPDVDNRCSQASTAVKQPDGDWQVELRSNVTTNEEYEDEGFVCTRLVTSCARKTCFIANAPASWTAQDAINSCRG